MKMNNVSKEDMTAYAALMRKLPLNDPPAPGSFDERMKRAMDSLDAEIDAEGDALEGVLASAKVRRLEKE